MKQCTFKYDYLTIYRDLVRNFKLWVLDFTLYLKVTIFFVSYFMKIDGIISLKNYLNPWVLAPTLSNTVGAEAPTASILTRTLIFFKWSSNSLLYFLKWKVICIHYHKTKSPKLSTDKNTKLKWVVMKISLLYFKRQFSVKMDNDHVEIWESVTQSSF